MIWGLMQVQIEKLLRENKKDFQKSVWSSILEIHHDDYSELHQVFSWI